MSVCTPTLIPRPAVFPRCLPEPPKPFPTPLPRHGRSNKKLNSRRDLAQEMDDLSAEEAELHELETERVRNRGHDFYVPLGRTTTYEQERNDIDADADGGDDDDDMSGSNEYTVADDESGSRESDDQPGSDMGEGNETGEVDLDDAIEDMDDAIEDMDDAIEDMDATVNSGDGDDSFA